MDWGWRGLTSEIERERPQPSVSRCGWIQSKPTSLECLPKPAKAVRRDHRRAGNSTKRATLALLLRRRRHPRVDKRLRRAAARAICVGKPHHSLSIVLDGLDRLPGVERVVEDQHPDGERRFVVGLLFNQFVERVQTFGAFA